MLCCFDGPKGYGKSKLLDEVRRMLAADGRVSAVKLTERALDPFRVETLELIRALGEWRVAGSGGYAAYTTTRWETINTVPERSGVTLSFCRRPIFNYIDQTHRSVQIFSGHPFTNTDPSERRRTSIMRSTVSPFSILAS